MCIQVVPFRPLELMLNCHVLDRGIIAIDLILIDARSVSGMPHDVRFTNLLHLPKIYRDAGDKTVFISFYTTMPMVVQNSSIRRLRVSAFVFQTYSHVEHYRHSETTLYI